MSLGSCVRDYRLSGALAAQGGGNQPTLISQEPAAASGSQMAGRGHYLHCLVQRSSGYPGQGAPEAAVQVCDGERVARPDMTGGQDPGGVHLQHTGGVQQWAGGGPQPTAQTHPAVLGLYCGQVTLANCPGLPRAASAAEWPSQTLRYSLPWDLGASFPQPR
jgi:hypothetical protein